MRKQPWWALRMRAARLAGLAVLALLLGGCATSYQLVQPSGTEAGSYYTSTAPYSGQGYYDYYGTGPYYAGTSGWGYYNGAGPYQMPFGYFGGFGYWPAFPFNLGFSSVWNFPGYWGPWYTGYPPFWRDCRHDRCRHHHHSHRHHHARPQDLGVVSARPALHGNQPLPQTYREAALANRPQASWATRQRPDRAAFAPARFVHAPRHPRFNPRPLEAMTMPGYRAPAAMPTINRAPSRWASPPARTGFHAAPRAMRQPASRPRASSFAAPRAAAHSRSNGNTRVHRH